MARLGLPEGTPALEVGPPPAGFAEIAIGRVFPSPTNPRKHFHQGKLEELAATIRDHGIVQPLVVRPWGAEFEIVAGERRWRAAHLAGLTTVPCVVNPLTDDQVLDIQAIENLQREDLSPIEEATGYQTLLDRGTYDVQGIAAKLGKTPSYVYGRLKLLKLADEARIELEDPDSKFSMAHATIVSRLPRAEDQLACLKHVLGHWNQVNPAQLREFISTRLMRVLGSAPFALDDAGLLAGAPACINCPKRTGAQAGLFVDLSDDKDQCLDTECYGQKVDNFVARQRADLEMKLGQPVPLVATSYEKRKGVVNPSGYDAARKGEPGAVKAVVADGADVGKTQWVKLREKPEPGSRNANHKSDAQREKAERERKLRGIVSGKLISRMLEQPDLKQNGVLRRLIFVDALRCVRGPAEDEFLARHGGAWRSSKERQHLRDVLSQRADGADGADLLNLLLELHLLTLDNFNGWQENKQLEEVAAFAGIDVAGVTAEAKAELKAAAKEEPAKKAVKKKAAKK